MATPIMSEAEWVLFFEAGGVPEIFVNVWNCRARIMVCSGSEYKDVTDKLPDGQRLAEEAVEAFGGAINISGWYPPTHEILAAYCHYLEQGGR
ncbi:MAG: hypothetical protein AB1330_01890 [Bacillota bacterium]